jgi:hypothetical protein
MPNEPIIWTEIIYNLNSIKNISQKLFIIFSFLTSSVSEELRTSFGSALVANECFSSIEWVQVVE